MKTGLLQVFAPLGEVIRPISLRTRLLIFLVPSFTWRVSWFFAASQTTEIIVTAGSMLLPIISLLIDTGHLRIRSRAITLLVLVWVIALVSTSIIRVEKRLVADESLATEAALDGLRQGLNPYARDYRGTLLDTWIGNETHESWINNHHPSATHYVYFPGHLLVSAPLYAIFQLAHWPYDQRIVYLSAFSAFFVAGFIVLRGSPVRDPLLIAFALNPFFAVPLAYGFNDLTTITGLGLTGLALARKRYVLAALLYGLALATKQWAAITLPFMVLVLFQIVPKSRIVWKFLGTAALTFFMVVIPFVLWSPAAIYEDTIGIFLGQPWYPISGEGISHLLLLLGVVQPESIFPFWLFELACAFPICLAAFWWLHRNTTLERAYLAAAIAIGSVWFFSRYFLHFHIVAVMMLIVLAFIIGEAERKETA